MAKPFFVLPPFPLQFLRMKPRLQSQQFPAYMSDYYLQRQQQQTLEIVTEDTNDSVFNRKVFSICDIIGNFGDGFILVHFEGYLYLVDQHAASEKSLFLQYMINPTKKYSVNVDFLTFIPNYCRQTLNEKAEVIKKEGWQIQELQKRAEMTLVRVVKAPEVYNKIMQEEDFLFFIERLYDETTNQDTLYSENEKNAMATYACRNAYKVGDRLKATEMRGLLDSLYKMDAPFNCPHGRPTLASLGSINSLKVVQRGSEKHYQL